ATLSEVEGFAAALWLGDVRGIVISESEPESWAKQHGNSCGDIGGALNEYADVVAEGSVATERSALAPAHEDAIDCVDSEKAAEKHECGEDELWGRDGGIKRPTGRKSQPCNEPTTVAEQENGSREEQHATGDLAEEELRPRIRLRQRECTVPAEGDDHGESVACRPKNHSDNGDEHTSELQSHSDLVCRLLLEKQT